MLLFVLSLSLLFNTNPATPFLALVVIEAVIEVILVVAMIDSTNARRLGWRR